MLEGIIRYLRYLYILNKLGFSQARTTIPKWVQRGAKNPLDKILSLVLSRRIAAQRTKESQTANYISTSTSSGVVVTSSGSTTGNAANAMTRTSMK